MHNAQVCYFNNVWLMFLAFKKKKSFQTIVGPPPPALVLCISHSGSLPRRPPPRPVLRISHSGSLTRWATSPGPSHFPLWFFNLSIPPPRPVLHISHSGSLTCRSPPPGPSHFPLHFFNLSVPILEDLTRTKEPSVPFISTTLPSRWFCGRTITSLAGSLTLWLFWGS